MSLVSERFAKQGSDRHRRRWACALRMASIPAIRTHLAHTNNQEPTDRVALVLATWPLSRKVRATPRRASALATHNLRDCYVAGEFGGARVYSFGGLKTTVDGRALSASWMPTSSRAVMVDHEPSPSALVVTRYGSVREIDDVRAHPAQPWP